jgi:Mg-chelatase subunit ChlI
MAVPANAYHAGIQRAVQSLTITRLMDLAANAEAAPQVRAVAVDALREIDAIAKTPAAASATATHRRATRDDIERFLARPDQPRKQTAPLPTPQGDPIGSGNQNR